MVTTPRKDHAMGALAGVAIGDAMGMPTQTLTRRRIAELYGEINDFRDAAVGHPVSHGLKAGTITDDTEQTLLLALHLIERRGSFDTGAWAKTLLEWERDTHARGVNDLLGPSTKRAIEALQRGVPAAETGRYGTTNGAAMRIVPVGIAVPAEPLSALVDAVESTAKLTHNTGIAIASASAVAVMVSAALEGVDIEHALPLALAAARLGETRGTPAPAGAMVDRIAAALDLAKHDTAAAIADRIGTSVAADQSVPMAFAVLQLAGGDPWKAALLSANIGDDTDTIGAIACGMAGAFAGFDRLPAAKWKLVADVNSLDIDAVADGLLALRTARRNGDLQVAS
jgi:ADP-ribosylglycohydrolase